MTDSGSFVPSQDGSSQGDLTPKMMAHTDGPEVLASAMMQTRTDLARGAEPGDSKQWLRSLKPSPESGKCACGVETSRKWATAAEQIMGRNWGFPYVWLCDACLTQREIAQLKRSLYTSPYAKDLKPELRAGFEARLAELERRVA